MQTTLRKAITFDGTGLHSGKPVRLRVLPASANYGFWFCRTDVAGKDNLVPARYDAVNDTQLCTRIANEDSVEVSTIEHLMAALAGTGVHNALIEVDGPEVPIMDGSAAPFVAEVLRVGLQSLDQPVRAIRVLKEITVKTDSFEVTLSPNDNLKIDFEIDFAQKAIGHQAKSLNMANGSFVRELSNCRTFCSRHEVEHLHSLGLGLGGSLDNAIVVDQDLVLNPAGYRRSDECVRHKMLDALGDLALAGAPILASYTGKKAGHKATNMVLRALFDQPNAYEMIECSQEQTHDLPGANISLGDFVQ